MVIGRGRRREYPNQHFVLLQRKKRGKNWACVEHPSGDVTSDQICTTTLVKKKHFFAAGNFQMYS